MFFSDFRVGFFADGVCTNLIKAWTLLGRLLYVLLIRTRAEQRKSRQSGGSISAANVPSVPAVIEMIDVTLRSYILIPNREPKLNNPDEVHEVIRGLKFGKAPVPNGIPNRALERLPQRVVSFLVRIFNAVLRTHHFPTVWKHARVISTLKPGKDPALPSSYWPIVYWKRLVNYLKRSH